MKNMNRIAWAGAVAACLVGSMTLPAQDKPDPTAMESASPPSAAPAETAPPANPPQAELMQAASQPDETLLSNFKIYPSF